MNCHQRSGIETVGLLVEEVEATFSERSVLFARCEY